MRGGVVSMGLIVIIQTVAIFLLISGGILWLTGWMLMQAREPIDRMNKGGIRKESFWRSIALGLMIQGAITLVLSYLIEKFVNPDF